MRIRNRPTPSMFPPPPDLNLNRSFPPPPPVQEPAADHRHATTPPPPPPHPPTNPTHPHHPRTLSPSSSPHRIALHPPPHHHPLPANSLPRQRRSGANKSSSTTASSDSDDNDDDNNNNITRKGRSIVQDTRVSHTKVENGWDGGMAQAIHMAADTKDSGKRVKGAEKEESLLGKGAPKRRGSRAGAAIMEGSRCSRVNGRGWRCGQQTLVGYSLCEHHLGKSRLRSLTSVKNTRKADDEAVVTLSASSKRERRSEGSDDNHDDEDDDDEALLVSRRKKSKIGTVKARSLSSLLGQTSQTNNGVPLMSAVHEKQPCS